MSNALDMNDIDFQIEKLQAKKRELALVQKTFPDAQWTSLPDGSFGYSTELLTENTQGVKEKFFYKSGDSTKLVGGGTFCKTLILEKKGKKSVIRIGSTSFKTLNQKELLDQLNKHLR